MPRPPALSTLARLVRRLPLALLAAAVPATATAQQGDSAPAAGTLLSPVVVTGSRVETDSFELPYSIDVVDMRAVQEGNLGVNASEALASVPGLVVQNRQNYAQDLQISIRGFGSRAAFGVRGVKLITDGIPASTPDGQGQAATFNLDTAERIEVLRGPFSTVYGNHAGGVIQLFSRDGQGAPRLRANALAGAWGTTKFGLGAEGETRGVGFVLDASRFDTDGYRDHSAATRDQAFAKLTLNPDAQSKLTLVASGLRQPDTQDPLGVLYTTFQQNPRAVESVATQFNTRKSIDHLQAGATYERRFGADRLQLQAYAGRRDVIQFLAVPTEVQANPRHSGGVIDFSRDFHGAGARWIAEREVGDGKLIVTTGVDYDRSEDDRQGYENFTGLATSPIQRGVRGNLRRDEIDTVTSLDPYLQASWTRDKWTLQAGLRHSRVKFEVDDRFVVLNNPDDSGSITYKKTTPAIGLVYRMTTLVNVYASAARGFETPTLAELSYSGNQGSDGFNFGLRPATSAQFELGVKAFAGESTRIDVAVFQIRTKDELVVQSNVGGRAVFQNATRTLRRGIELAVDSEITEHLRTRFAVTHLRAVYDQAFETRATRNGISQLLTVNDGNRIPGIPATTVYGEVEWRPLTGISTAVEALYRTKVHVHDLNDEKPAPGHALVNLRASAEQKAGAWTFGQLLRIDNVLDRKHIGSVIVGEGNRRFYEPGPERSWYAGLRATYQF